MARRLLLLGGALALASILLAASWLAVAAPAVSGYAAKILGSGHFVSGRSVERILHEDLEPVFPFPGLLRWTADDEAGELRCNLLGMGFRQARLRPGLGCPLDPVEGASPLDRLGALPVRGPLRDDPRPWPAGDALPPLPWPAEVDRARLEATVASAFDEQDPLHPIRTRAVLVTWKDRILAERYASDIHRHTALVGWSMSKSVTAALVGVAVRRGLMTVADPILHPAWSAPDDPRRSITVEHCLHMSSGLAFDESYGLPPTDVTRLLFLADDPADFAARKALLHLPGRRFSYSTATTKLLCFALQRAVGPSARDGLSFPREALFEPLGMRSAVFECSSGGRLMGGSFVWASARDWARFGLLHLHDGVWAGRRILPEGWVDASTRPASSAPTGNYGYQCWLNRGRGSAGTDRPYPALPPDTVFFQGHEGQQVALIPSAELLVLRLGATHPSKRWDRGAFTAAVLACLRPAEVGHR